MQLALKSCALKHALTIAAVSQQAVMRLVIEMVFNKHSGLHDDTSLISMHIYHIVCKVSQAVGTKIIRDQSCT